MKFKQINNKEYDRIKAALNAGVKAGDIKRLTGRAYNTINFIKLSQNLEDYRFIVKETKRVIRANDKPAEVEIEKAVEATTTVDPMIKILNEIANALWAINTNLTKKRSLF